MATELRLRRGTTTEHSSFIGAEAEATVDTDKNTIVVHDGATTSGYALAREDMSNVPNDTISGDQVEGGTIGSVQIDSADINGGAIDSTVIGGNNPDSGTFTTIAGSGDMNIDSGTLFVDSANNRVGVGVTSPSRPLHIDSGSVVNTPIRIEASSRSDCFAALVNQNSSSELSTRIGSEQDDLVFETGGAVEAMRIDSSANLKANSGYGSVATAYVCRAWVNFDGTGTVTVRESGNVSSVTDNGTGEYTINFENSFPDSNYAMNAQVSKQTTQDFPRLAFYNESDTRTTTQFKLTVEQSDGAAKRDNEFVEVAFFR